MLHILSHYIGVTTEDVHQMLIQWVPVNIAWIYIISNELLTRRKIDLDIYLSELIHPNFIYDEVAITIVA